ncbi:MAG: polysaccharide deacetylase family protein [Planctomycetaceae bacterium]
MAERPCRLALSVDLEEWYHSGRWVDGASIRPVPDMQQLFRKLYGSDRPAGEIIAPTRTLLDLFDRHGVKATFFVLGEVAQYYPHLVREVADRGHEIACHGMHHVDMSILDPGEFASQLDRSIELIERAAGVRPRGYRAPNLIYEPWATRILEARGFAYDATVCASRPLGGKYQGWANAPSHPYHPSYDAIGTPGDARLVEVPLPSFPVLRFNGGSSIMTRVVGYSWTYHTLRHSIKTGDTSYYLHPWEIGPRPNRPAPSWKSRLFLRRTGPWFSNALERILRAFSGRIVTVGEVAATLYDRSVG